MARASPPTNAPTSSAAPPSLGTAISSTSARGLPSPTGRVGLDRAPPPPGLCAAAGRWKPSTAIDWHPGTRYVP